MNEHKGKSPRSARKRRAPKKATEVFEDCTITVQGDKVWMSGPLADELAETARQARMSFQEAFIYCVRTGLPSVVARFRAAEEAKASGAKDRKRRARKAAGK